MQEAEGVLRMNSYEAQFEAKLADCGIVPFKDKYLWAYKNEERVRAAGPFYRWTGGRRHLATTTFSILLAAMIVVVDAHSGTLAAHPLLTAVMVVMIVPIVYVLVLDSAARKPPEYWPSTPPKEYEYWNGEGWRGLPRAATMLMGNIHEKYPEIRFTVESIGRGGILVAKESYENSAEGQMSRPVLVWDSDGATG